MLAQVWAFLWPGWAQVWPNMVASILFGAPAFVWHHFALRRHITKQRLRDE